jgi:hypothetical protein
MVNSAHRRPRQNRANSGLQPPSRRRGTSGRSNRAKRTQFGPASQKAGSLGDQRCETKPIPAGPDGRGLEARVGGRLCRTKPICLRARSARCGLLCYARHDMGTKPSRDLVLALRRGGNPVASGDEICYKDLRMCGFWTASRRFGASDRVANRSRRPLCSVSCYARAPGGDGRNSYLSRIYRCLLMAWHIVSPERR